MLFIYVYKKSKMLYIGINAIKWKCGYKLLNSYWGAQSPSSAEISSFVKEIVVAAISADGFCRVISNIEMSLFRKEEPSEFFSTVRPEEVPEIPSNKFLFRGSPPKKVEADR